MEDILKLDVPPLWALLFALAAWCLAIFVPIYKFDFGIAGLVVAPIGFAFGIWANMLFRKHKTSELPRQVPTALVSDGPYRINRNPMYTGLTVILIGIALWLGDISAFIPAIIYPFMITRRFILDEEAALQVAFPDDAKTFMARTRRW